MKLSLLRTISLLASFSSSALAAPTQKRATICNGQAALCDRKYSNVSFVGAHDSAFVGQLPTQNQLKSVSDQLNSGVRFLTAQTHSFLNSQYMCHTSCWEENSGKVQAYVQTVKTWLDNNPNEVVTLLLTNGDKIAMSIFDSIFKAVGADKYKFIPSTSPNPMPMDSWPTLGDMITAGTRLVVFIDYGADEKTVPYLLDEFNYFFETPFDTTDPNFAQCTMDRQNKADNDGKSSMYIVNHFLDMKIPATSVLVPDRADAGKTNAATGTGSIGAQADLCVGSWGKQPNVVLVDYFGQGQEMNAQNTMNGLSS
ncbi:PLC-like phosphodiesterase [Microthyrium microscopicum]|uniref:PLC-like phosphodiesterase n=1 Tax=Microthyrium microscopicum TaxID=703497 RepID=A0A6A6UAM6_9PEZI|nr:PLC-like phosphodiesterase [Microthyrium microscopicum]